MEISISLSRGAGGVKEDLAAGERRGERELCVYFGVLVMTRAGAFRLALGRGLGTPEGIVPPLRSPMSFVSEASYFMSGYNFRAAPRSPLTAPAFARPSRWGLASRSPD